MKHTLQVEEPPHPEWVIPRDLVEQLNLNQKKLIGLLFGELFYLEFYFLALIIKPQEKIVKVEIANIFANQKLHELVEYVIESNKEFNKFTLPDIEGIKRNAYLTTDKIGKEFRAFTQQLAKVRTDQIKNNSKLAKESMVFARLTAEDLDLNFWYALKAAYLRKISEFNRYTERDIKEKIISYCEQYSFQHISKDLLHLIRNNKGIGHQNWQHYEALAYFIKMLREFGMNDLAQLCEGFNQEAFIQLCNPQNSLSLALSQMDHQNLLPIKKYYQAHSYEVKKSIAMISFVVLSALFWISVIFYDLINGNISRESAQTRLFIPVVGGAMLLGAHFSIVTSAIDKHFIGTYDEQLKRIKAQHDKLAEEKNIGQIPLLRLEHQAAAISALPTSRAVAPTHALPRAPLSAIANDQARLNDERGRAQSGFFWNQAALPERAAQRIVIKCTGDRDERTINIREFITFHNNIYGYFDEAALLNDWVEGLERFRMAFNNRRGRDALSMNNLGTNGIKLISDPERRTMAPRLRRCNCLYKIKVHGPNRVVAEQVTGTLLPGEFPVQVAVFRFYVGHDLT